MRCRACNAKMEVLRSRHGGFEELCHRCRSFVIRDLRNKPLLEESLTATEVPSPELDTHDDWEVYDRNHEWNLFDQVDQEDPDARN